MQQLPVVKKLPPIPQNLSPDFNNFKYLSQGEFGYVWFCTYKGTDPNILKFADNQQRLIVKTAKEGGTLDPMSYKLVNY